MKRLMFIALMVVVAVGIGIALKNRKTEAVEANVPVNSKLVEANNQFGIRLFTELASREKGKNVFISPASVAIALCMTYNGANGRTKQAMADTLGLNGMSLEDVNKANEALLANLREPGPGVEMSLANSLWARDVVPFHRDFMQRNEDFYDAKIAGPFSKDAINDWVSDETRGRINDLVDYIDPNAVLFLVNAIYFKGEWETPFEPANGLIPFKLPSGSVKEVLVMHNHGEYDYLEEPGFQAIRLPYGKGRIAMYVFLPDKKSGLNEFYKQLTPENWKQWKRDLQEVEGDIYLPKFKVEYGIEMSGALKAMGMGAALNGQADFSKMSDMRGLYIKRVLHKAFVEVNEEGTEAAASTAVEMVTKAPLPTAGPFKMVVDRPFFITIADDRSGEVLFMGAINNP